MGAAAAVGLLIVLNGIEILNDWFQPTFGQAFNRTKWN